MFSLFPRFSFFAILGTSTMESVLLYRKNRTNIIYPLKMVVAWSATTKMLYGSQGHQCSPVAVDDDLSGARHDKVGSLLWVCDRLVGEGLRAVLILPGQQQILHPQLETLLPILPPGGVAQLGTLLLISLLSLRSCVFTGGSSEGGNVVSRSRNVVLRGASDSKVLRYPHFSDPFLALSSVPASFSLHVCLHYH